MGALSIRLELGMIILNDLIERLNLMKMNELKEYSKQKGMEDFVFIPKDGESLQF